jgi:hypothetical protein
VICEETAVVTIEQLLTKIFYGEKKVEANLRNKELSSGKVQYSASHVGKEPIFPYISP